MFAHPERVCEDSVLFFYSDIQASSVNNLTNEKINKSLLKVIDVLGRETKGTKNQPLFYIYDDGTVEKRIIIE